MLTEKRYEEIEAQYPKGTNPIDNYIDWLCLQKVMKRYEDPKMEPAVLVTDLEKPDFTLYKEKVAEIRDFFYMKHLRTKGRLGIKKDISHEVKPDDIPF